MHVVALGTRAGTWTDALSHRVMALVLFRSPEPLMPQQSSGAQCGVGHTCQDLNGRAIASHHGSGAR